jgi:hypothetical protein
METTRTKRRVDYLASSLIAFVYSFNAHAFSCRITGGQYGYNEATGRAYVAGPIVIDGMMIALLDCDGEPEGVISPIPMSFQVGGYHCPPISQLYPLDPTDYVGSVPDGLHGTSQWLSQGVQLRFQS